MNNETETVQGDELFSCLFSLDQFRIQKKKKSVSKALIVAEGCT